MIERPSSRSASEFELRSLLQHPEQWPSLIAGADSVFSDEWVHWMQDAMGRVDSVLSDEQMHRRLEALQQQMKQSSDR